MFDPVDTSWESQNTDTDSEFIYEYVQCLDVTHLIASHNCVTYDTSGKRKQRQEIN
jgi:hypothetical protein